ncbi:serine hydrolase FSH [Hyaloraphidium curvatum]|nr:serine hydrolase FSH [Hyaloraphidium curvatum]
MKILALHGYTQDASAFSKKTAVLRKTLLRDGIEVSYVSAPHRVPPIGAAEENGGETPNPDACLGWWMGQHWGSTKEVERRMFGESMDFLVDHWRTSGPFDGLLGFSQGAAMAALLMAKLQTAPELGLARPKFAILIAGFDPTVADTFAPLMNEAKVIDVEGSLHISGQRDTLIVPERTKHLMERFFDARAEFHSHGGGHVVPSSSGDRKIIVDFVTRFKTETA